MGGWRRRLRLFDDYFAFFFRGLFAHLTDPGWLATRRKIVLIVCLPFGPTGCSPGGCWGVGLLREQMLRVRPADNIGDAVRRQARLDQRAARRIGAVAGQLPIGIGGIGRQGR